ncbi:hypothetical protein NAG18_23445 [Pseudomonas aeruginosa]|nr:hypothetical protein [Pseudomonas aeruginosa]
MRRLRPARRAFQALLALVFCCLPHVGEAAQLVLVSANQGAAVNAFRDEQCFNIMRPEKLVQFRTREGADATLRNDRFAFDRLQGGGDRQPGASRFDQATFT